ncbi:hypothetical protein BOO86_15150 [Mycobacterium sp. CBMA 234]|uniref:hypothetical protein n=1 Tax=Mycolicibacterium sp. CBMA 234 TaxID=1918495 RepID=UPI0012DD3294|nr:hypothetical protein [Mycolicibacterium sp. CBMA 234]MUL65810.1 hypothetical protein [Mycolicibacterium sp. CBMA 234]
MTATIPSTSSANAPASSTDYKLLRVALWSVCIYVALGLVGFAVCAGFWPPPGEYLDAAGIYTYFHDHASGIKIGMMLMVFAAPWYYTWSIAVSKVISRLEGPMGPLAMTELLGGLMTALVTAVPAVAWLTAVLRIGNRSAESVQVLYDFGWLFFDMTYVFSALQSVALGVAILRDHRDQPLIPRWVAYVAFLTAIVYVPLSIMPFVRTGPFAWQGLLNFWAVFVMFFMLIAVVTPYANRAIHRLEREALGG